MALDWRLGGPKSVGVGLNDLIARKKYAKAIEVLRAQFRGRAPGAQVRLQLADLLVLAGRAEEAVPVLIGLADEFAADGFVAKAVAILKKVEKIRRGMPEVESRLASLVRLQRGSAVSLPTPPPASPRRLPDFGMEEMGPETLTRLRAVQDAPPSPSPPEPRRPPAAPQEAARGRSWELGMEPLEGGVEPPAGGSLRAEPLREPALSGAGLEVLVSADWLAPRHAGVPDVPPLPAEPEGVASRAVETAPEGVNATAAPVASPAAPEADGSKAAVSRRLRGALRRFLASLPDTPPDPPSEESASPAQSPDAPSPGPPPAAAEAPVRVPPLPSPEAPALEAHEPSALAEGSAPAGVAGRLRSVFRRLVGSRTGSEPEATEAAEKPAPGPQSETPEVSRADPQEAAEAAEKPAPGPQSETPEVSGADPQEAAEAAEKPAPGPQSETPDVSRADPQEAAGPEPLPPSEPAPAEPEGARAPAREPEPAPESAPVVEATPLEEEADAGDEAAEAGALEAAEAEGLPPSAVAEIPATDLELMAEAIEAEEEEENELEVVEEADDELEILGVEDPDAEGEIFLEAEPLETADADGGAVEAPVTPDAGEPPEPTMTDEAFEAKLLDFIEELCRPADASPPPTLAELAARQTGAGGEAQVLLASPLFVGLSEPELLAVVQGLRLLPVEPGDVILTEGQVGDSVFILTSGVVKIFVTNPDGRNYEVSELREGSFFGEISSLSGRPRNATVTAASRCDLLELDRATLDSLTRAHPGIREVLAAYYAERSGSPEAAAVRAMPRIDSATQERALEILERHFGERRWDPRMRLRLADALAKAGKFSEAVPILVGLADDLAGRGFPEKSIALLKKVERMRGQVKEFSLAPLKPRGERPPGPARAAPPSAPARRKPQQTATFFQDWIVGFVRDTVKRRSPSARAPLAAIDRSSLMAYGLGLQASPLFQGFSEEELLALIRGLKLLTAAPGDIVVTEGERSEGIFIVATGEVKLFIRNPAGRDVPLCVLQEGSFFGEISTLSSRPRSATVVAASRCELLELDPAALDTITESHPHVREVLEAYSAQRSASPEAASIRSLPSGP